MAWDFRNLDEPELDPRMMFSHGSASDNSCLVIHPDAWVLK